MSTTTIRPPESTRTVDELITELAACMTVPHFDDVLERQPDLYTALCDAVTPERDRSTAADFCERCQPAYLRVDEQRNAELMSLPEPTRAALSAWLRIRGPYPGPLFLALGSRGRRAAGLSAQRVERIVTVAWQRADAAASARRNGVSIPVAGDVASAPRILLGEAIGSNTRESASLSPPVVRTTWPPTPGALMRT